MRVAYEPLVAEDFKRIISFLETWTEQDSHQHITNIISAVETLAFSPWIGRPARGGLYELVIGRGNYGYLALYSVDEAGETVTVLRVRAQREEDYPE